MSDRHVQAHQPQTHEVPAHRAHDVPAYDVPQPSVHLPPTGAQVCESPAQAPAADPPADVALLLRAHAERSWLSREVIPVVRQIEAVRELPDDQRPAALAYLEVVWAEALGRARETDAERTRLDGHGRSAEPLCVRAHRHHACVRALREAVARRVTLLLPTAVGLASERNGRQPHLSSSA